jgi:hypothetical protein
LALDTLFTSWNSHPDKLQTTFRLCLAWNEPNDELRNIFVPLDDSSFKSYQTKSFNININRLWKKNKKPLSSWRRFRKQSEHTNRDDFVEFCKHFIIETNFPKLNCDIYEPGDLEKIVLFPGVLIPRHSGGVETGGAGDLFPRIREDLKVKSSIPRPLGRGFFISNPA